MLYVVLVLVVMTALVAGLVLLPRLQQSRLRLDGEPDYARPFGTEMSWIAIGGGNPHEIMEALGLTHAAPASWECGLGLIYDPEFADRFVFVTPAVNGWTLVAGVGLPMPSGGRFVDKLTPLLQRAACRFDDVQYFATHPVIDFYGWARLKAGSPVRTFAAGEAGVAWDSGAPTREERLLGLTGLELRGIRDRQGDIGGALLLHPSEARVLALAQLWSFNPMAPPEHVRRSTGFVASVPVAWRAERASRAA